MRILANLFENNKAWASEMTKADPSFFTRLARQQSPEYLWIGCSDSRVPANEIVGLAPGELFVHRNVANLAIQTDMNYLSVMQYAVDVLHIRHIIVCGHYGCGGVKAAIDTQPLGLIDNWLSPIREVYRRHEQALIRLPDREALLDRLCELNVVEQVHNVVHSTIVQDAWRRGQDLSVHGWIYRISDGLLRDLNVCISSNDDLNDIAPDTDNLAGQGDPQAYPAHKT
jgi:carbonic anhydrase